MENRVLRRAIGIVQESPLAGYIAKTLQPAIRQFFAADYARLALKELLQGKKLIGHPLHPILTDVPIGAWMMAAIFDAIDGARKNSETARLSDLCIWLGIASVLPTALSGLTDWSTTSGRAARIGVAHAGSNVVATVLYTSAMIISPRNRALRKALAYCGFSVLLLGGFLGGHLVFGEGIGVDGRSHAVQPDDVTDAFPVTI